MITGVQDVYYNVSDMNKSLRFYKEALQMKVDYESEYWAALDCHGTKVGLHLASDHEVAPVARDSHGAHGGATLTLRSNDVPADRKKIEQFGVKILGEFDQPWGHMLVFEDHDGNVLKLMNPK